MSCDNIEGNGSVAKTAVGAFAALKDPELAEWIDENGAFPNSMVDRITTRHDSRGDHRDRRDVWRGRSVAGRG